MTKTIRPVYVVGGMRTPFVRSMTSYSGISSQELMTFTLRALVEKFSLRHQVLGDVALGAVMNSSSNWNLARECVLGSGLHPYTPAYNVQRACGTSLEAAGQLALKIGVGQIESAIAGGVDTNSDLPIEFSKETSQKLIALSGAKKIPDKLKMMLKFRFSDLKPKVPGVVEPRTLLSMGQHCERMVQVWNVSQREQDELALTSHMNAHRAYENKFYSDLVCEFQGVTKDSLVRSDTSIERLSKLKPAFDFSGKGTLTAGNSSPLTDGASAVLLASSEECEKKGWPKQARFVDAQVSAVDFVHGDGLLMAPTRAVGELLRRNQLKLQDFDFYEIHEAFSGQVLCTLKAWESEEYCLKFLCSNALGSIDRSKMNIYGGSVALGHPFAATGARIISSLAKALSAEKGKRGLISVCTGGGMGVAAILESC